MVQSEAADGLCKREFCCGYNEKRQRSCASVLSVSGFAPIILKLLVVVVVVSQCQRKDCDDGQWDEPSA